MELVDKKYVEGCVCKEIVTDHVRLYEEDIIPEMIKIMGKGIGLAAPQVGMNKRFFIMKYQGEIISCYNPEITFKSKQKKALKEGCLTYPQGIHGTVNIMRPVTVNVKFLDKYGIPKIWKLRGLEVKCFQHELDHLNGITIFNRNGVNHG
jgi:peptide deformylase